MKLLEHQGKELFKKYGIKIPESEIVKRDTESIDLKPPFVLKAQVFSGNRKREGGIVFVDDEKDFVEIKDTLFDKKFGGQKPETLLVEEKIENKEEIYLSFSYSGDFRSPVLAVSQHGGTGIENAEIFPVDLASNLSKSFIEDVITKSSLEPKTELVETILSLWNLFITERALLVEINPLFETNDGQFIAGDSKIILDDSVVDPKGKPFLDLDGDIAVIASGGGASLVNLDALIKCGGRPANYVEYSGNPSTESVKELTKKVLTRPGLKGCWVVGGTANFTDIYETMLGFVQGLKEIDPKPDYPIVIRRDGPRQKEAFEMLEKEGKDHGFDFYLFGPETSMANSAEKVVELSYKK